MILIKFISDVWQLFAQLCEKSGSVERPDRSRCLSTLNGEEDSDKERVCPIEQASWRTMVLHEGKPLDIVVLLRRISGIMMILTFEATN